MQPTMTEISTDTLCPGCFAPKGQANPCPNCGYDERAERSSLLLPHRTLLNGQFVVGRVLGKPGGFGITYLAWDLGLQRRVAIKEYLPRELAGRGTDRATVAPHSSDDGDAFGYGMGQFLTEARTLARLDNPNIVRVLQVFEANATAYLVMEFYQGLTLAEHLDQRGGRLQERSALALMQPVLDGLRAVHAEGFLHRDIKPQNIYLARMKGGGIRPILLDFGAARQAMSGRSRSLSVVLSEGYAPFEQYGRKGKQGTWTDVYAAAAVLYRMVTGLTPPPANDRMAGENLEPASIHGASTCLSDTLTQALALRPEARPQTVPAFQSALWPGHDGPTPRPQEDSAPAAPRSPTMPSAASAPGPSRAAWPLPVALALIALAGGIEWWLYADWQRNEQDAAAYASARAEDTWDAYRVYLDSCSGTGCRHRVEAQQRLAERAAVQERARQEAKAAAERVAAEQAAAEQTAQVAAEQQAREAAQRQVQQEQAKHQAREAETPAQTELATQETEPRAAADRQDRAEANLRLQDPAAETAPTTETAPTAVPTDDTRETETLPPAPKEDLNALLQTCQEHFAAQRYTVGKEGTALACYREALRLDSGNAEALSGLAKMEEQYHRWATDALARGDLDKTRSYISRMRQLNPSSAAAMQIESALVSARAAQERRTSIKSQTTPRDGVDADSGPFDALRWIEQCRIVQCA